MKNFKKLNFAESAPFLSAQMSPLLRSPGSKEFNTLNLNLMN